MKIGMLVNNLDVSGGYQKLVLRLSEQLTAKGHKVVVYSLSADRYKCYPDTFSRANIISLGVDDEPVRAVQTTFLHRLKKNMCSPYLMVKRFKSLSRLMDDKLDGLIIHDSLSLYGLNFYKSRLTDFRVLWMINNQLPEHFGSLKHCVAAALKRRKPIKLLIAGLLSLPWVVLENLTLKGGLRRVDIFAVYDARNKALVESQLKRKANVVYAGCDVEEYKDIFRTRTYPGKDSYNILSVGVMFPHRRHEDLINATALLLEGRYNVTTVIVGRQDFSPEYYHQLTRLTKRLKLKTKVIFKNYVSGEEMRVLYKNADAFVFVNDGRTWGIAVFEAVAAGLPVVITNNIGAADLIENVKHGWVVEPCNPSAIASSIREIIEKRTLVEDICHKAFRHVTDLVSWNSYARRIISLLEG